VCSLTGCPLFWVKINYKQYRGFDIVTAVFLLNYASTKRQLRKYCSNIFDSLAIRGKFFTILENPGNPLQKSNKYEVAVRAHVPLHEGDEMTITYYSGKKEICSFRTHHWSQEIYEEALRKAGFRKITWCKAIVSNSGFRRFGRDFWADFLRSSCIIGLDCRK
jgi:toxoflavin synthase